MGIELFKGWEKSETLTFQQGNLLTAITKAQGSLMSSDLLVGITLTDLDSKKILISYGKPFAMQLNSVVSEPTASFQGLLSFSVVDTIKQGGTFQVQFDYRPKFLILIFSIFLFSVFIFSLLLWYQVRKVEKSESAAREKLLFLAIENLIQNEKISDVLAAKLPFLVSKWSEVKKELEKVNDLKAQIIVANRLSELADQVSHDIRSPLTALNMVFGLLSNVPEEHRLLIKNAAARINDISNQLLQKGKLHNKPNKTSAAISTLIADDAPQLSTELLPALIDVLVSEKRIQFRDKINLSIETNLEESYGAFVNINSIEIKRVLSNLITNAAEALEKKDEGRITVCIKNYTSKVIVSIRDNGTGIPKHILEQLGQRGITHGKEGSNSGSGLGIYHAKKTIESFDGVFEIQSQQGLGTEIRMIFKSAPMPKWFVENLELKPGQTIVILDDDSAIHSVWLERFSATGLFIKNFTSGDLFYDWVLTYNLPNTLYLVDYELLNQSRTGLQLIKELKTESQSILVTSRFEDEQINVQCEKLGVKLIPKTMANLIPIEVIESIVSINQ